MSTQLDSSALSAYMQTDAGRKTKSEIGKLNPRKRIDMPDGLDLAPKYFIYIFNLRQRAHELNHGTQGRIYIPACEPGQPYSTPLAIPSVNLFTHVNTMTNVREINAKDIIKGEDLVKSIINPGDGGVNTDLTKWGVFVSFSKVPKPEEVAAAKLLLEATYNQELRDAELLAATGKLKEISNTQREAAIYFNKQYSWNQVVHMHENCPGCGEATTAETKVHKCGYVRDWQWAVENGMRTKEQVPEGKQWWINEPSVASIRSEKAPSK
jgi:hypothetical protein